MPCVVLSMHGRVIGLFAATGFAAICSLWALFTNPSPVSELPSQKSKTDIDRFVNAAIGQIGITTSYSPGYVRIPYPNGDIPLNQGVCTDVVIRAMRAIGTDLQKSIHEDARRYPSRYPRIASLDSNIDHRRCPNMWAFLEKYSKSLDTKLRNPEQWRSGDIVFWKLTGGKDHVGILSTRRNASGFPYAVHNIGAGVLEEDVLANWTITKRFRLPLRTQ